MPINKLQPNRTLHLRGFDALGAAAALHDATTSSFKVSGIFRDPADFCVLILHDADNFYEHPSIRYLPDSNFGGLTLSFDVHYSGLRPLDSPRYATIDWPYLDVIRTDSTTARVPLYAHAQKVGGQHTPASAQFTIVDNGFQEFDRLTLWYLNLSFDYIVPKLACSFAFTPGGEGTLHSITVAGTAYSYTEVAGDTEYSIAQRLADAAAVSPWVTAVRTFAQVDLKGKKTDGVGFDVSASSNPTGYRLHGVAASTVAADLAAQINRTDWPLLGVAMPVSAQTTGATITLQAVKPGVDGNAIIMYAVAKNANLTTTAATAAFSGGVSDATWRITLDFTALGIPSVRQMWLTFAPPIAIGQAFTPTEWQAAFTNWTLTGDPAIRALKVAGPGSVRVDDNSSACLYSGTWTTETGFYSRGYAKRCAGPNDQVTVSYHCAETHDLWLGTSLYVDRGTVAVRVDGGPETTLDCRLDTASAVITRRRVAANIPAGSHTVTLRSLSGFFYFDFLEAVVASDVPAPRAPRSNISPALDYSTDHTYKLSPARLLWNFDQLGFAGPMNEYIGVFWWNQRVRTGAVIPSATVTFAGAFVPGDQIFLNIGGQPIGKTVFPTESNAGIAAHFARFINATFVGVWASAADNVLTITTHSPAPAYSFTLTKSTELLPASTGTITIAGALEGGVEGSWEVDPSQTPALNRGAREWHADFYRECAARNREITTAVSMELVNPPASFPARYSDGTPVMTAVGFGNLTSTHCAFNTPMRGYQVAVYQCLAGLMSAAGATPRLQCGEFCWWYFQPAFYDSETQAAALAALGRPLHVFTGPDDDPTVNAGADALFLRNRLRDHVAAILQQLPAAQFEVLFPYDVNYPSVVGIHNLGGRLIHAVNFPAEWSTKATAGFDTLKMEALDFGAGTRSLELAREAMEFPMAKGWQTSDVRYLLPVFNGGCPWRQEYRIAKGLGIPAINLWAFDHVCIFNLSAAEPSRSPRAARFS